MHQAQFFNILKRISKSRNIEELRAILVQARPRRISDSSSSNNDADLFDWFIACIIVQLRVSSVHSDSSAAISLSHLHYIYLALELLWEWRVRRYIELIRLEKCDHGFSLSKIDAIHSSVFMACDSFPAATYVETFEALQCISDTIHSSTFHGISMQRNIGRILVSFIILGEDCDPYWSKLAKGYLHHIIRGASKNRIVFGFQCVTQCSLWIKKKMNSLMQEFMFLPGGFEAVVRGYLENNQEQVALLVKVLTLIPEGTTKDVYFPRLCAQLVQLVTDGARISDKLVLTVCAQIVSKIYSLCPELAHRAITKEIGKPLLQLILCEQECTVFAHSFSRGCITLSTSEEIQDAVLSIHALLQFPDLCLATSLIGSLHRSGLGQVIICLALYCHSSFSQDSKRINGRVVSCVMNIASSYARAMPEKAAQQFELALMIPSRNEFSHQIIIAPSVPDSCIFEVRNVRKHKDLVMEDSEDAYCSVMERVKTGVSLLLYLLKKCDAPFHQNLGNEYMKENFVREMISALHLRTLRAFFGLLDNDSQSVDSNTENSASESLDYISSSGSGIIYLLLQEKIPKPVLLRNKTQIVNALLSYLERHVQGSDDVQRCEDSESSMILSNAMNLLHEMTLLNALESVNEIGSTSMKELLPVLEKIAASRDKPLVDFAQTAAELGLSILTSYLPLESDSKLTDKTSYRGLHVPKEVQELLDSNEPAMKALGIKSLVHFYCSQANSTDSELEETMQILLSLLTEGESFVYLNSLHGFNILAGYNKSLVIKFLLRASESCQSSVRLRSMVGEGIFMILKKFGSVFDSELVTEIASSCIRTVQMSNKESTTSQGSDEDILFLQSSAVSILAECVSIGGWGSAKYLTDALDIVLHLLLVDNASLPLVLAREMRRSAAFLLHRIISGLENRIFFIDGGQTIKAVYRALKMCTINTDKVVVFHAKNALSELSDLVSTQFSGGI